MGFSFLTKQVIRQKENSGYRRRHLVQEVSGNRIVVNGQSYLNFSSNDYLGLNQNETINKALEEGAQRFGASSCSSSLVTGYSYAHCSLEDTVCQWVNKPKCLLFNSGFSANHGVLNALASSDTQFLLDKLSHASLIDGALSGKAKVKRFQHNDYQHLTQIIENSKIENNLIVSEGVFSMDGDKANVHELNDIAAQHNAWLYIDDAHSIGVHGDRGQGSASAQVDIDVTMATFGKAISTSGAFVACNESLHEYLVNFSRHYIYSTAMSPAIAWATKASIELIQQEQWRRDKIVELSELFSTTLNSSIKLIPTSSSIHAIVLGSEESALAISEKLRTMGIWLTAIRPPTVAKNTSRLRVTICANHNNNDINYLVECLNKVIH